MKQTIITLLLFVALLCNAQSMVVNSRDVVVSTGGYYPMLNTEGDLMLYTSESYQGLWLMNLSKGNKELLTNAAQAGYEPRFSNDNNHIFYRQSSIAEGRKYTDILSYTINTRQQTTLKTNMRQNINFQSVQADALLLANNQRLQKAHSRDNGAATELMACSENLQLVLYKDGLRQVLSPIKEPVAGYIWVSLSPNKKQILFTAAGSGTYICDLKGNIIANLGYLNAPTWYGNDYVVGMCDKDNGDIITSSTIVLCSTNGTTRTTLSQPNEIAMNPTTSIASNKVAYNTLQGKIILITLQSNSK